MQLVGLSYLNIVQRAAELLLEPSQKLLGRIQQLQL
jgi:hypothetical protein